MRRFFDRLFYHPTRQVYDTPRRYHLRHESVSIPTPDGLSLHGWFFPAEGVAAGTVLHLHGNAGNVTGHFRSIAWLPHAGWDVLCFDYRGYGQSQGRISREGSLIDAHAALDYLLQRPGVQPRCIVAFGQSLGGAIGVVLAAERPEVRGLVVDGAFDHYRDIVYWHMQRLLLVRSVAGWLSRAIIRPGYDPVDYVARISPRPILIMHGTADQIVDPVMAENLYRAAQEPKQLWLIEGMDHYQALLDMPAIVCPRLTEFFKTSLDSG